MADIFKNICEKISSYDFLNNFIPGAVYIVMADYLTTWSFLQRNVWINILNFYVVGLIISRIGSLVIGPILKHEFGKKKKSFIKYAEYDDFTEAEKKDAKITVLSMMNNVYRTFIAVFLCLGFTTLINQLIPGVLHYKVITIIGCLALAILFMFSYRKQTKFVSKRVNKVIGK